MIKFSLMKIGNCEKFAFFLFVACVNSIPLLFNSFGLHQYAIDNDWQQKVSSQFKQPVEKLVLDNIIVSSEGLYKLFEEDLSSLKILHFKNIVFSSSTICFLFQQNLIYEQIESLRLQMCNIKSSDFSSLQERPTKLKQLLIGANYISLQGFTYISRLKMNLTSLDLKKNSLTHHQSVNEIIKWGLRNLNSLNLCGTKINSDNLLKLLSNVTAQLLEELIICEVELPIQFYEQFSKMNFSSLKFLSLFDILLGAKQTHLLERLNVTRNQLFTQNIKNFVTKKVMPKLHSLQIESNLLDHKFAQHLVTQGYTLQLFHIYFNNHLGDKFINHFSQINTSSLKSLQFTNLVFSPESLVNFFYQNQFEALESLKILQSYNIDNICDVIFSTNMPSLHDLQLPGVGFFNQTKIGRQYKRIQSLSHLKISIKDLIEEESFKFLQLLLTQITPNLKSLSLQTQNFQLLYLNYKILKNEFMNLTNNQLLIQMNSDLIKVQFLLTPNDSTIKCLQVEKDIQNYIQALSMIEQYYYKEQALQSKQFYNKIFNSVNFQQITTIIDDSSFFVFDLVCVYQIFLTSQSTNCSLKNLTSLQITLPTSQKRKFQIFKEVQFPQLKELKITLNGPILRQQLLFFQKFKYIQKLQLFSIHQNKQIVLQFLKNTKFQYLQSLHLQEMKFSQIQFRQIFSSNVYLERINQLFILSQLKNDDFNFLKNFTLRKLVISQMKLQKFGENFCLLNFEFLEFLELSNAGIDDQDIIGWVACMKEKGKNLQFLKILILKKNLIKIDGAQALMRDMKLPNLQIILLTNNGNPHIFNNVFTSPYSRKLHFFVSAYNALTSIDPNINPKNFRNMNSLALLTNSLRDSDFQILSTFQFTSINSLALMLSMIKNCETLHHIRQISFKTLQIQLVFEEISNLTSNCLQQFSEQQKTKPTIIQIQGNWPYNQLRYLVDSFLHPKQSFSIIQISKSYVSSSSIQEIGQSSYLKTLKKLILSSNNLTDNSVKHLFKNDLKLLQNCDLSYNPISGKALSLMINKNFNSLIRLDLSNTYIDDEGIKYLITNNFPKLIELDLVNTEISNTGLKLLQKLPAPLLTILNISCNLKLTVNGLSYFDPSSLASLLKIVFYPEMYEKDFQRLFVKYNQGKVQSEKQVLIITDIYYEPRQS